MSDCSTSAFDARPIKGFVVFNHGRPRELTFARYVNGVERKVDHVTIDGTVYERARECVLVDKGGKTPRCSLCGYSVIKGVLRCSHCGAVVTGSRREYEEDCEWMNEMM